MFNQCQPRVAIEANAGAAHIQHNPPVAAGKAAFIDYFARITHEYPGKSVHFKRTIAEGHFVVLHCHRIWPGSDDYAGIDISRFDEATKIVGHCDVLQAIAGGSKNDNKLF